MSSFQSLVTILARKDPRADPWAPSVEGVTLRKPVLQIAGSNTKELGNNRPALVPNHLTSAMPNASSCLLLP